MLTEKQKQAVAMLYRGERVQDTAQALGVHRTTIWRWKGTRDFRLEWRRIDRNLRRKYARREAKRRAEEEAFWENRRRECEERVKTEAAKITGRPSPAFYRAWNEYEKALFRGLSLSSVLDLLTGGNPRRHKGRRR